MQALAENPVTVFQFLLDGPACLIFLQEACLEEVTNVVLCLN
jgi:hypothetical protein